MLFDMVDKNETPPSFCDVSWEKVSWNNTIFGISPCFQSVVLSSAPCVFLWICAPFYIWSLAFKSTVNTLSDLSLLAVMKTVCGALMCLSNVVQFGKYLHDVPNDGATLSFLLAISALQVVTLILCLFLMTWAYKKAVNSSGIFFLFWLLVVVGCILEAFLKFRSYDEFRSITFSIWFSMAVLQLLMQIVADNRAKRQRKKTQDGEAEKECPEGEASFLSRVTYFWMTRLMIVGYKRVLTLDDLPNVAKKCCSTAVYSSFEKNCRIEHEKQTTSNKQKNIGTRKLCEQVYKDSPRITDRALLLKVMAKTVGSDFVLGGITRFLADGTGLLMPYIIGSLVTFVETPGESMSYGVYLTVVLTGLSLVRSVLNHQSQYYSEMAGKKLQTALTCAIFRKSLKLSFASRKDTPTGKIINLMSVDTATFEHIIMSFHCSWSAPLVVASSIVFVYGLLGVAAILGLTVMVLMVPVLVIVSSIAKKVQAKQMSLKDVRIKVTSEILNGIKVLKLYAWEQSFVELLLKIRENELGLCKTVLNIQSVIAGILMSCNNLVILATYGLYVGLSSQNVLDSRKMAVTLAYLTLGRRSNILLIPCPEQFVQASVAISRLAKFLTADELDVRQVTSEASDASVHIYEADFSWYPDEPAYLKNVNIEVPKGKLVAIVGTVGSGKTSIISAILGKMSKRSGSVNVDGSIAYIPQQAWISNASVRENILLFKDFHLDLYHRVVRVCALKNDLATFPGGDLTEIGEKGINLSGGQKQRISLARAVYQDQDIYLLDDPLSALDCHVGKHVFDKVIGPNGILSRKTRILVTNGLQYLPHVDLIYLVKDGTISEHGTYESLVSHEGAFTEFIQCYLNDEDVSDGDSSDKDIMFEVRRRVHMLTQESCGESGYACSVDEELINENLKARRRQRVHKNSWTLDQGHRAIDVEENCKLTEVETSESGRITCPVLKSYFKAFGCTLVLFSVLLYLIEVSAITSSNIWLTVWVNDSMANSGGGSAFYVGVYGALCAMQVLCASLRLFIWIQGLIRASEICHVNLLRRIVKAPMTFFDTTPTGRLLNRFSKDVNVIDNDMLRCMHMCLYGVSFFFKMIVLVTIFNTIFLVLLVPLVAMCYFTQRFYARSSRQLRRMDMVTKSPVYSLFGETFAGVDSIRTYGQQENYTDKFEQTLDRNFQTAYSDILASCWMGLVLEVIGTCVLFITAVLAVTNKTTNSSVFGVAVSTVFQFTLVVTNVAKYMSDLETNFVAVERMKEYSEIKSEAEWYKDPEPPSMWPTQGKVEFREYGTCYRKGLPLVLRGVNCIIKPCEKIGIVGRTGAGKSTLIGALFRILEPVAGTIYIDGVDVTNIGLHQLRSKITVIPQDPVVFSGSLRINLDPCSKYSDDAIWKSLEDAHLKPFVQSHSVGLEFECTEGGENLSVGQKQLICLARSLLRKTKILVLDEATAAVDMKMDDLIQTTIRTNFKDCTVLTIAHRLNTILDYDRVMVLDQGKIKEFDSPKNLLADRKTIFFSMAKTAGLTLNHE